MMATLIPDFTEDTAKKTGIAPRTVRRQARIGESIPEDVRNLIRDTPIADNQTELLRLARKSVEEQREIAERDENSCRKAFTPEEAVALGREIEEMEKVEAKKRQAQAGPSEGRGQKATASANFAEPVGQSRDKAAEAVGMSGETYRKAKAERYAIRTAGRPTALWQRLLRFLLQELLQICSP